MCNIEMLKKYRDAALEQAVKASSEETANGFLKLAELHEKRIIEKANQK